jgi:hypothetical protein
MWENLKPIEDVLEKEYNYIYITTNLLNNKQYIGEHSSNNLDAVKTINYLGSGQLLKLKIKEYGRENFKKEILEFFPKKSDAHFAQERYIQKYNTLVPNGYNISPSGGLKYNGYHSKETIEIIQKKNKGKKRSDITKERLRLRALNMSQETKDKIGISSKNRSKESNYRCGSANRGKETWMKGKHHTEESNRKNREKHLGISFSDEINKKKGNPGKSNPMYGKTIYDVWKEKYGKEEADIRHFNWRNKLKNKRKHYEK